MEPALLQQESILCLSPAEPLWQRVPTRDEKGKLLGDFMMLIPQLRSSSVENIQHVIDTLNRLFSLYHEFVVFADLNLKLNILWVSHKPRCGVGLELAAAIHELIPEAKLVAQHHE